MRVEAAEASARRIGDEPGEGSQPTRVGERRQGRRVRGIARRDAVDRVERHELRRRHGGRESSAQIRPDDPMPREAEAGAKQLPEWPRAVVRAPAQPFLMARQTVGDVPR